MIKKFETKRITVALWDDYLEQTINVEAIQKIYNQPFPIQNRRLFKSAVVCHEPKFNNLQIIPNGKTISLTTLLKIANSFDIENVQIKTMESRKTGKLDYLVYYGESSNWDPETNTYSTIENDLEYDEEICYGVTELSDRKIIHTKPIKEEIKEHLNSLRELD